MHRLKQFIGYQRVTASHPILRNRQTSFLHFSGEYNGPESENVFKFTQISWDNTVTMKAIDHPETLAHFSETEQWSDWLMETDGSAMWLTGSKYCSLASSFESTVSWLAVSQSSVWLNVRLVQLHKSNKKNYPEQQNNPNIPKSIYSTRSPQKVICLVFWENTKLF